MLQNAYLLAKIGADTAENERHLADILLEILVERPTKALGVIGARWTVEITKRRAKMALISGSSPHNYELMNL